jgi:hypothetical protein
MMNMIVILDIHSVAVEDLRDVMLMEVNHILDQQLRHYEVKQEQ